MTDLENAIQEFEDNAYHPSMKPTISVESKAVALAALREKAARENQKPLTFDELKKMGGDPVWIVEWDTNTQSHAGHWELSTDAEDYLLDREECFYGMTKHDCDKLHPLGWLAYRTKTADGRCRVMSNNLLWLLTGWVIGFGCSALTLIIYRWLDWHDG